jgi:non-homologous end joining protein Ku
LSGVRCVVEVRLTLTYDAIRGLVSGETMAVEIEEEDLRVVLIASEQTVELFRAAQQQVAMLLGTPGAKH